MSNRRVAILAAVVAVAFFVLGMLVSAAAGTRPRTEPPQPPNIGGQPVPDVPLSINFDKRYDVHCILLEQEPTVFKDVKIVGFTGPKVKVTDTGYSLSSSREKYFEQWLVLELKEKRLVYIPPSALKYLEETKGS